MVIHNYYSIYLQLKGICTLHYIHFSTILISCIVYYRYIACYHRIMPIICYMLADINLQLLVWTKYL